MTKKAKSKWEKFEVGLAYFFFAFFLLQFTETILLLVMSKRYGLELNIFFTIRILIALLFVYISLEIADNYNITKIKRSWRYFLIFLGYYIIAGFFGSLLDYIIIAKEKGGIGETTPLDMLPVVLSLILIWVSFKLFKKAKHKVNYIAISSIFLIVTLLKLLIEFL